MMPFVRVQIGQPPGSGTEIDEFGKRSHKTITTWALLDTGSGSGLVDFEVVERLELNRADTGTATTVNGQAAVERFKVMVGVCGRWQPLLVAARPLDHIHGAGMILGVDWLNDKRFRYDGPEHRFSLQWD